MTAKPIITLVKTTCDVGSSTYTVEFNATIGAKVSASVGNIVGNTISSIPSHQMVVITAQLNGCLTSLTVSPPNCSCPSNFLITGNSMICPGAVSYTHLDVYKRQGLATRVFHGQRRWPRGRSLRGRNRSSSAFGAGSTAVPACRRPDPAAFGPR